MHLVPIDVLCEVLSHSLECPREVHGYSRPCISISGEPVSYVI